ncbi:MAG: helix-turn-helix transcriptional regulator [Pseudomonadota bacterium]
MQQTDNIVAELKRALRAAGVTYAALAQELDLSEASVKRLFQQRSFSLQRLEQTCNFAGIEVADLVARANANEPRLSKLTPEQELRLLENPKLVLMIYMLLNQWRYDQIVATFDVSAEEGKALLKELESLGMLEIRSNDKVKLLTARNFSWRNKGPVQRFFRQQVQPDFFNDAFDEDNAAMHFVGARLSERSYQVMQQEFERLLQTFDDLARQDARLPAHELRGCGATMAIRPWEFAMFTKLRRVPRD